MEDSSEKSKGFVCDVCSLKFLSSTELFDHSFTWEHRVKQDSKSSSVGSTSNTTTTVSSHAKPDPIQPTSISRPPPVSAIHHRRPRHRHHHRHNPTPHQHPELLPRNQHPPSFHYQEGVPPMSHEGSVDLRFGEQFCGYPSRSTFNPNSRTQPLLSSRNPNQQFYHPSFEHPYSPMDYNSVHPSVYLEPSADRVPLFPESSVPITGVNQDRNTSETSFAEDFSVNNFQPQHQTNKPIPLFPGTKKDKNLGGDGNRYKGPLSLEQRHNPHSPHNHTTSLPAPGVHRFKGNSKYRWQNPNIVKSQSSAPSNGGKTCGSLDSSNKSHGTERKSCDSLRGPNVSGSSKNKNERKQESTESTKKSHDHTKTSHDKKIKSDVHKWTSHGPSKKKATSHRRRSHDNTRITNPQSSKEFHDSSGPSSLQQGRTTSNKYDSSQKMNRFPSNTMKHKHPRKELVVPTSPTFLPPLKPQLFRKIHPKSTTMAISQPKIPLNVEFIPLGEADSSVPGEDKDKLSSGTEKNSSSTTTPDVGGSSSVCRPTSLPPLKDWEDHSDKNSPYDMDLVSPISSTSLNDTSEDSYYTALDTSVHSDGVSNVCIHKPTSVEDLDANTKESIKNKTESTISDHPSMTIQTLSAISTTVSQRTPTKVRSSTCLSVDPIPSPTLCSNSSHTVPEMSRSGLVQDVMLVRVGKETIPGISPRKNSVQNKPGTGRDSYLSPNTSNPSSPMSLKKIKTLVRTQNKSPTANRSSPCKKKKQTGKGKQPLPKSPSSGRSSPRSTKTSSAQRKGSGDLSQIKSSLLKTLTTVVVNSITSNVNAQVEERLPDIPLVGVDHVSDMFPIVSPRTGSLPIPSVYNEISRPSATEMIRAGHGNVTESASLPTNSTAKGSEILYTGHLLPPPACTSTASNSSLPFVSSDADTAQQSVQAMIQSLTQTTLSNFSSDQPIFSSSPVQSKSKQPRPSYKGQGLFSAPLPVVARLLSPESILQLARLPQRLPTTSLPVPRAPKHPTQTTPSKAVTQGTENKSNRVASESSGSDRMKVDNASPGTPTAGTEVDLANSVAVSSNVDVVKKPLTVVLQQEDVRRTSLDNLKSSREKTSSQKEKLADLQMVAKKEEVALSVGRTAMKHQSTSGTGLQLTSDPQPKVSVKEEPIEFDTASSVTSVVTTTDVGSCERRRVCLWSYCRNSVHSGRLCLKHSEFSDKIRAQILGEQSPLTPPTCPPPSHLPHPSHPPHTSQSVTTLFSSVSQPILFGDIRHVDGPSLISNFDERRTTFSGKALKEGLPPSAAGTSQGLPPSSSIKDRATQGLPPSIPIKEGSKQGFTKEDASNKQGLPQQTTIHNQNLARTNRDENQEHHVPRHAASSKRVLPPTGQRSKEGLPPPKQTTITIEPNTRKRRAVDEQEVSSLNNHRATKEVVLPPKKKHKPDVLHIASNVSTCEPSAGGDSSEGETPVVESSLLSPAFVNEINVLNQEERDIQLKLFEVQSTLNDLLPTEEGKSKECESLRRERESEQRICDQLKAKLQGVFSKKQEVLCGSISTQSMEMMKKFNEEEREFQHDLIRAMTCLTEKDKRLSELDHELTALNTKKIELTTRKQDLTQTYQQILKKKQDLIFQPSQFLLSRPSCPSVQSNVTESTGPSSSFPSVDTFSVTDVPIDDVLHSETSSRTAHSAITSTPTTEHISVVNSTSDTDAHTSTVDNRPEVVKAVKATAVSDSCLTRSGRSTAVTVSPQPLQPVRQSTTTAVHSLSHPRAESAVVKINDSEKTVEREKVSQSRCLPLGKQVDVSVNQPGKLTKETDQSEAEKQDQSKMKQHSVKTKEPHRSQPGVSFGTASTSNKKTTKEIKNVNSSKDISSKAQKRSRSESTSSDTETKSKRLCLPQFTALPEGHSAQTSVKRVKTSKECSPLQLKSTRNKNIDKTKTCAAKLHFSEHLTSPSDPGSCSSSSSAVTTSERSVQKQNGESNNNNNSNSNAHLPTFNQPDISTENNDTDRERLLCSESSSTLGGFVVVDSIPGKGGSKPRGNQQMTLPSFQPHTKSVLCLKACDNYLFSTSSDSSIHVYDIDTGRLVMNLPSYHKKAANSLAVYKREDDLYFLSGSSDKCIHMHSVKRRKKVATFEIGKQIMSIDVSGDLLFAGLKTGAVLVINIDMNVKDKKGLGQNVCHDCTISYLCVDKHYLFTGSFDNTVAVWDMSESIANGLKKSPFKRIQSIPFPNTPLCIKVHDGCLFVACGDSNVYIYDMKDWTQLHLLPHSGAATGLEIVGNVLVTSSFDKYIRCFDVKTLKLLQLYAGYQDKIFCVCVSGAKIFAGMGDGSIKGVTMDLTAFYVCKWKDCGSRFGVLEHLTDYHLKDHINPKMKLSTSCEWDSCSRVLNPSDLLNHLKSHCQDLQ